MIFSSRRPGSVSHGEIFTHTHTHTHTHTLYIHTYIFKMGDDENQHVEDSFSTLVSITEKSGNLRKDLKNDILESVSTLRQVFSKMKTQLESKSEENKELSKEVMKVMEEMARMRDNQ